MYAGNASNQECSFLRMNMEALDASLRGGIPKGRCVGTYASLLYLAIPCSAAFQGKCKESGLPALMPPTANFGRRARMSLTVSPPHYLPSHPLASLYGREGHQAMKMSNPCHPLLTPIHLSALQPTLRASGLALNSLAHPEQRTKHWSSQHHRSGGTTGHRQNPVLPPGATLSSIVAPRREAQAAPTDLASHQACILAMSQWLKEDGAIFIDTESRFSAPRLCEMAQAMLPAIYSSQDRLKHLAKRCTVYR